MELKAKGNELYRAGKYEEAIQIFSSLIAWARESLVGVSIFAHHTPKPMAELLAVVHCNRAAAWLKMGNHVEVIKDCRETLRLGSDPYAPMANSPGGPAFGCPCPISEEARRTVIKALGRRSAAHEALDNLQAAIVDIQHALILDYDDEYDALGRYRRLLRTWKERERAQDLTGSLRKHNINFNVNKAGARQPKRYTTLAVTDERGLVEELVRPTRRKRCACCRRAKETGRLALRVCACDKVYYCSLYCQKTHWSAHAPECTFKPPQPQQPRPRPSQQQQQQQQQSSPFPTLEQLLAQLHSQPQQQQPPPFQGLANWAPWAAASTSAAAPPVGETATTAARPFFSFFPPPAAPSASSTTTTMPSSPSSSSSSPPTQHNM